MNEKQMDELQQQADEEMLKATTSKELYAAKLNILARIKAVMSGIRPVVAALIIHTGISFLISTIGFDSTFAISIKPAAIILAITAIYALFRLAFKKKLSSVLIIIISAFFGIAVNMIFNAANV